MKPKLCSFVFLVLFFALIISENSCRKLDRSYERNNLDNTDLFFKVPTNALPIVKKVAAYIKTENESYHFIDEFVKRHGIPKWDKAKVVVQNDQQVSNRNTGGGGGSSDSVVLIPTVRLDSNIVHSFLACHIHGNNVKIRVFDGAAYKAYPNNNRTDTLSSSFVTLTCIALNYIVTGREWYRIKDTTLVDSPVHVKPVGGVKYLNIAPQNPMALLEPITFTTCISYVQPGGWNEAPNGESYGLVTITVCTDYTFWATVIDDGPIYSGPPPSSGGGGGGGWYNNNPCRSLPGDNPCGSGAPLPYSPVVDDMGEYNPYQADTIRYSSALKNSYPCMYHLINDSLMNLNFIAQLAGTDLFKDSVYMHLTFDTSTVYTQAGQASGDTDPNLNIYYDSDGFLHYQASIQFNGFYLRNGTKEYKLQMIIHETMHALFTLRWKQYQRWLNFQEGNIDSFFIKQHFPNHWYYITQQNIPINEIQDHEIMAEDYSQFFSTLIRPFYNQNATTNIRDTVIKALSYCGLTSTTAWSLLPGQGMDTCKYRAIQVCAERSLNGGLYNTGGLCRNYGLHYSDSLKLTQGCY